MAETHPLATAIGTASTKGVLSDLIAQLAVERKARPNFRRVLAFAVFGGLYLGAACVAYPRLHLSPPVTRPRLSFLLLYRRLGPLQVRNDLPRHLRCGEDAADYRVQGQGRTVDTGRRSSPPPRLERPARLKGCPSTCSGMPETAGVLSKRT